MRTAVSVSAAIVSAGLAYVFRHYLYERLFAMIYAGRTIDILLARRFLGDEWIPVAIAAGVLTFTSLQFILYWKPFGLVASYLLFMLSLSAVRQLPYAQTDPLDLIRLLAFSTSGLTMLTWVSLFKPWRNQYHTDELEQVPHPVSG